MFSASFLLRLGGIVLALPFIDPAACPRIEGSREPEMSRRVLMIFAVAVVGTLVAAVSVTAIHRSEPTSSRTSTLTR
jgi:hypothetical protein